MTIRVWLIVFVLLFAGVELLEWIFKLGSAQASGYWTLLGGLGLAAASNAKHLPKLNLKLGDTQTDTEVAASVEREDARLDRPETIADKGIDRSEDSISFRVRLPWR